MAGVLFYSTRLETLLRCTMSLLTGTAADVLNKKLKIILILGSAPDAVEASGWKRDCFHSIVVINNAWSIRPDWDYLIHPEDFDPLRVPTRLEAHQSIIAAADYVPVQNAFGGFVYAGGTMAFTAGYWALGVLKPDVMAFFGCDMNYGVGPTHFYGHGTADPLRDDITLQSLEAKSARLMLMAAAQGCLTVNLSSQPTSRLLFPVKPLNLIESLTAKNHKTCLEPLLEMSNGEGSLAAIQREAELGYMAANGRYWEVAENFDAEELMQLDRLWLAAAQC
jgi:hypothetical protein